MKTVSILSTALLLLLFFTSCKKENLSGKIVGKWQIREVFNGYANGGDFQWSAVPAQYQTSLEFNASGGFIETYPAGWMPGQCTGTYSLLSEGEIQISSNCATIPYQLEFAVSNRVLTISYLVREGVIREKFVRVN